MSDVVAPIYNAKTPDKASVAIINTYSKYKPQDAKTDDIVSTLRNTTIPDTLKGSSAVAYVSGSNAAFTDIGNRIFSRTPWFLLYIIGITFVVMAMAFRSLVVAAKAALTTLASAVVAFGALTFVIQLGHGMGIIGLDRTGYGCGRHGVTVTDAHVVTRADTVRFVARLLRATASRPACLRKATAPRGKTHYRRSSHSEIRSASPSASSNTHAHQTASRTRAPDSG